MVGDPGRVEALTIEDGVIENATALLYFSGSVVCVIVLYRGQTRLFAAIWLVLCIIFLGEETSWFQRLLGYSVPEVEAINSQAEFNLHNIYLWHGKAFIDKYGQFNFDISFLLGSQNLFRIGFFIYFLAIPVIVLIRPLGRLADRLVYPKMATGFLVAVWTVIITSFICAAYTAPPLKSSIAEVREMFYAPTICVHTFGFLTLGHRPPHAGANTPGRPV